MPGLGVRAVLAVPRHVVPPEARAVVPQPQVGLLPELDLGASPEVDRQAVAVRRAPGAGGGRRTGLRPDVLLVLVAAVRGERRVVDRQRGAEPGAVGAVEGDE